MDRQNYDFIDQKLNIFAAGNGIIIGTCSAERMDSYPLEDVPFSRYTGEQRVEPKLMMDNAESIIVVGVGYGRLPDLIDAVEPRGRFSSGAAGPDYHRRVRGIIESLREYLSGFIRFDSFISVDTGPLPEKILAVRAGLGYIGKNGLVISKEFGSFFNIGYMLVSAKLPLNSKEALGIPACGVCDLCAAACPGGALTGDGFDYRKCVSFLTQKKGELSDAERRAMGVSLYGCDVCQTVCPKNKGVPMDASVGTEEAAPELRGIIDITAAEFRARYGETAIYWRGPAVLRRNAAIALENLQKKE